MGRACRQGSLATEGKVALSQKATDRDATQTGDRSRHLRPFMIGGRKDRATFEAVNLVRALPSIVRTPSIPYLESTFVRDQWSRQRSRLTLTGSEKTIMSPFEIDKLNIWIHGRISPQDARKGRCSHRPNPGAPRRASPQVRSQRAAKNGSSKLARIRFPLMAWISPPLRASNEGLLRPRVARAQGTRRAIPPPASGLFQHPV
jgi:hypothetical protein